MVVLKNKTPDVASRLEPLRVQYFTVLAVASFINRMVLDNAAEVLVIIKSFVAPVAFTRPSMVTLSAPLRSISGAARLPEMLKPVAVGYTFTVV